MHLAEDLYLLLRYEDFEIAGIQRSRAVEDEQEPLDPTR